MTVQRFGGDPRTPGRIVFWPGGSLWIGEARGRTQWHDHHAHQLVVAPEGRFRFRTQADGAWVAFAGALVPSHRPHQFESDDAAMAHCFIEPESRAGRAIAARHRSDAVVALPEEASRAAARALFDAYRRHAPRDELQQAAMAAIATLCGTGGAPEPAPDARLARALAYMREQVRRPLTLREVADAVALSESRFRHLFAEQTGCSFRAYLLWLRINLAIESVTAGASWTEAAHDAGFADSAHLSRTHKRMFGIEPSAIRAV